MTYLYLTLFTLFLLIVSWVTLWRSYFVDKLREDLFTLRDELFNLALENDNNFTFDHPLYRQMEKILVGTIHFADNINFLTFFLTEKPIRKYVDQIPENKLDLEFRKGKETLSQPIYNKVDRIYHNYNKQISKFMFKSSLLFLIKFIFDFTKVIYSERNVNQNDDLNKKHRLWSTVKFSAYQSSKEQIEDIQFQIEKEALASI